MTGSAAGRGASALPFSNGVRPGHLVVMVVFLLVRQHGYLFTSGQEHHGNDSDQHPLTGGHETNGGFAEPELRDGHEGSGGHGHGHGHGYTVFHVDFERVQLPFIISLWIFVSSLAKIGFHMTPKLHHIFPESCLLIVVGIIIGFLLIITSEEVPTTLTPDVFFLFMLPPIILDAGYFMPNRLFFDHLGTILLMAVVGTIFNMLTVGSALWACGLTGIYGDDPPSILETFMFASLIVAVDPVAVLAVFEEIHVDEILYIVVFGESLLNDAVTVVLYNMFDSYVEIGESNVQLTDILKGFASFLVVGLGGTIIGIIWGYVTGFVTRFTNHARVLEPLFVFVMAYMSYLNAETFHLSGILAITFCGITMKNYVERNISSKSQTTLKYAMKMLSGSSETIIFMFLGVATVHDDHEWNWAFVVLTIVFCSVFRVIGVFIFAQIANRYRLHKLKRVDQFVMMYGGLRGAVAFALALLIDHKKVPHAPMFVTTTIAVVYWTVFVQGITIKPLVKFLNVKTMSEKDVTMNERITGRFMDHVVSGMEGILGQFGNLRLRDMYKGFDTKYIKPCLLRENQYKDPKIIETFENLTNKDAVEFMKRNPTQFAGLRSMAEMAGLPSSTSFSNLQSASSMFSLPSQANMENLDMKHMIYSPSQKDLTESKIHHLLSENLFMPRARPRRMSYSRHAVDDSDLSMQHDVNYKVHMQVRRMLGERRAARRRNRERRRQINGAELAAKEEAANNQQAANMNGKTHRSRVTFETETEPTSGMRVSGSDKQLRDEMLHDAIRRQDSMADIIEEEDEDGITFTTQPNAHVTLSENDTNNGSKNPVSILKYSSRPCLRTPSSRSMSPVPPVLAQLNWFNQGGLSNPAYVKDVYDTGDDHAVSDEEENKEEDKTMTEKILPWKRNNPDETMICEAPVKQREFPAWLKNESYMTHGAPSETIVGEGKSSDEDFDEPPPSAQRLASRRNSEADYQERVPMSFPTQRRSSIGNRQQLKQHQGAHHESRIEESKDEESQDQEEKKDKKDQ